MKQIIAILRNERVEETKKALKKAGVRGVTFLYVTGRGQQKGRIRVRELKELQNWHMRMQVDEALSVEGSSAIGVMESEKGGSQLMGDTEYTFGFLPKRMLIIVADDKDVNRIVQGIVNANQTGHHGDGRIFICPMISALRIRTGEQGSMALS
jgi:nitrogen regulatory protein PII 2